MKHIYSIFLSAVSLLWMLSGCVEDPDMDTRLQKAKAPEVSETSMEGEAYASSITLKAQIMKENGLPVKECGVCWSTQTGTEPLENMRNKRYTKADKIENHNFTATISNLEDSTKYYVYAYAKLVENGEIQNGDPINITVPTGNFGNILAAYFAKQMGIPVKTLICASNDNKVLYDFFRTGIYDKKREFILTSSPSMDILISSNLERLIYLSTGCDAEANRSLMEQLNTQGSYEVTETMKEAMKDFTGGFATEAENAAEIKKVYEDTGYVIDTHTGVASAVYRAYAEKTGDTTPTVIASTASPYKFSHSVMEAIRGDEGSKDEFAIIDELCSVSGVKIPAAVEEIRNAEIRHKRESDVEDMEKTVAEILGL